MTLIEVLIGISIVGLLLAILAPAVMWSREAARRGQCLSHMKQMGIAIHAFQSSHEIFPPGADENAYSFHVSILPQIDQAPLQDLIQQTPADSTSNGGLQVLVPIYICPSDPFADLRDQQGGVATNYLGNYGTGVQRYGYNGMFGHSKRARKNPEEKPLRPQDIQDGLSNTAMLSEVLSGDGTGERLRTHWHTDRRLDAPDELDSFAQYCKNWVPKRLASGTWHGDSWFRGRPWVWGDPGYTWYNHVLTPNQLSCFNQTRVQQGIYTATSLHRGGVNVLYADGRAKFVSESIDRQVWTDLGSRDSK